ncbi:MAG: hypothetical protein WKG01_09630 [Kofleriaceae bacterium]
MRTVNSRPARVAAMLLVTLLAIPTASADKATTAARAFSEGQQAALEGDHERAAERYELANSIMPSKEALRSAVRARLQANQLARAATLADELLAQYASDEPSSKLANQVLADAKAKLGVVHIACSEPCSVSIGGRAVATTAKPRHALYLADGTHSVEAGFGGDRVATRSITTRVGEATELAFEAPPVPAVAPSDRDARHPDRGTQPVETPTRRGLPRYVPIAGAALTLVAGGVATWSSLDTQSAHDDYVANPTDAKFDDGRSKQLRTNILWGATAALGIGTALAAVWTDWSGKPRETQLGLAPGRTGTLLVMTRRF